MQLNGSASPKPAADPDQPWLVWQLVDSAFPTGGYAHSNGLEAAWHQGEVRNAQELISFLTATLDQVGNAALPFVTTAHLAPQRFAELDQLSDAFMNNHVANRASRLQGRAFLSAVTRVFFRHSNPLPIAPMFSHFAPVFGTMTQALGLPQATALRLFLFHHLRGLITAAVRLNIVGPMQGQQLQQQIIPQAEDILGRCGSLGLEDLAQTAPLLDLWQGAHDRLYSRLFQS